MEEKHIDQLTLGEKIGRALQASEPTDKKMGDFSLAMERKIDKFIEVCDKRFCGCEAGLKTQGEKLANLDGRATVFGIVGGLIMSAIGLIMSYFKGN